jgi:alpha-1,6-mannosyltransferase
MPISTLHLTNAYHAHSGGIRTMYHALLTQAEHQGRRMTLVVPGAFDDVDQRGAFTRIVYIRAPHSPVVDRRYRVLLPHRFLAGRRGRLWRLIEDERPDVIEVCDKYSLCFFAGLIRRRRGPAGPTLVGLSCERLDDNLEAFAAGGRIGRLGARAYLGRAYIGMFDAHVANSAYTAEELRAAMRAPHLRPVHVCAMGVDPLPGAYPARAALVRAALEARTGAASPHIVTYAGRLSAEKQVMMLPDVIAALAGRARPVHLFVAGDGPLRQKLHERARALAPGRVHFVGHLEERRELAALLASADVFLHPNGREPFGIGPLEAMSAGTPVVAPASGGLLSYATADNAWLAEPQPAALARAVSACLDNEPERRRRVAGGRVTANRHAWPAAAARMLEQYDLIHAARMARLAALPGRPAVSAA